MASISVKQGEDRKLDVVVVDQPPVDFSTATELRVILFVGDREQAKYSKDALATYGKVTVDGTNKNTLHVYVERDDSVTFDVGSLSAHVIAVFVNTEFADGVQTETWDVTLGRVTVGRALDETL